MYGEDYLDNLFTAVYYTPTGNQPLFNQKSGGANSKGPSTGHRSSNGKNGAKLPGAPTTGGRTGRSKFVNNIRQHSNQTRGGNIAEQQRRPMSAPAQNKGKRTFKPKEVSKIAPYDSYVKRREADFSQTEPVRRMDSSEYPMFPVLAQSETIHAAPSRVTYHEPEAGVMAQESSHFADTAPMDSIIYEKPSTASGIHKYSSRPYDVEKQYTDLNEWIGLRQNYIHQIESLEKYEKMCGASQVMSEISMPNFYALLIALRKISIRIADNYRMIVIQKDTPLNLLEVHDYVIGMVTDMNCLDRQPFIDWTGLHLSFNPFICGYRADGSMATAMSDLNVMSKHKDLNSPALIPQELVIDQYETAECRDLGAVLWGAYQENQRKRKKKEEEDEAIREQIINASVRKAELAIKREAFEYAGPQAQEERCRKRAWIAWKRAFDLNISINNMASVRRHIIKRNVFAYLVRHTWIAHNFRRMLEIRANRLKEMTFQGWFEYLCWVREFNRVYYNFCLYHKQYCFNRLKLLMYYDNTVRTFKRKVRQRPLFLTFRALKRYSLVEGFLRKARLKNGTRISFADLNLRYFTFSRWARFTRVSICTDQMDLACRRGQIRIFFKNWKTEVFGIGIGGHIKKMVTSTSAKFAESAAASVQEDAFPVIEDSRASWTGKLSSKFSGMLKRR